MANRISKAETMGWTQTGAGAYQITIIAESDAETVALRTWSTLAHDAPASAVLLIKPYEPQLRGEQVQP